MRAASILLALGALAAPARAQTYDAVPLVVHVRPTERASLAAEVGVRLDVLPLYELHLAVEDQLRSFGLRETITVTNDEATPLSEVVLRIFANAAVPAQPPVRLLRSACLEGVACTVETIAPSVLRVALSRPLAPGASVRIELDLAGSLRSLDPAQLSMMAQGLEGLSHIGGGAAGSETDYGLLAQGLGIASLGHFYAELARREAGRWVTDDGGTTGDLGTGRLAHVRARIVVPQAMQVVASGVEVQSLPVRDAPGRAPRREVTVVAGLVRDFSLLVGATLESAARDVAGVTVRSWYLPQHREAGRRVLETAASALETFEQRFGPYPYVELDVAEAPLVGGAGGVEWSGLVTVASMFYETGPLAGMAGPARDFVTAHEVAHQWWYGLVGSDPRSSPWVDESLAQWSALLWVEARQGAARADQEAERQIAANYRMMRSMGVADGAVARPAGAFSPPIAYAGLVYGKGALFYRAARRLLGDEAFFAALSRYAERWRFRSAPDRAPLETLAVGRRAARLRALGRRWLDEAHGDEDVGGADRGGGALGALAGLLPPGLEEQLGQDPAARRLLEDALRQLGGGGGDLAGLMGLLGGGEGEGGEIDLGAVEGMLGGLPEDSSP